MTSQLIHFCMLYVALTNFYLKARVEAQFTGDIAVDLVAETRLHHQTWISTIASSGDSMPLNNYYPYLALHTQKKLSLVHSMALDSLLHSDSYGTKHSIHHFFHQCTLLSQHFYTDCGRLCIGKKTVGFIKIILQ